METTNHTFNATAAEENLRDGLFFIGNAADYMGSAHVHVNFHGLPRILFDALPGGEVSEHTNRENGEKDFWAKRYPAAGKFTNEPLVQFFTNEPPDSNEATEVTA